MASPKKPERPSAWLSKREVAAAFDVSQAYFDRDIRQLVQDEHVRRVDGRLEFYARGVIDCWTTAKAHRSNRPVSSEDLAILLDW